MRHDLPTQPDSTPPPSRHYALAMGAYTHFTSPIRRYPDVVVHRLLAAALDAEVNGMTEAEAVKKHRLFDTELCGKVGGWLHDR